MAKFDNAAFVDLVWKNERKIINGRSIKDLREAIAFFRSPGIGGISKSSQKTLELAKERSSRALNAMGLSLDFEFPQDPVQKNKIWKEQIEPMRKGLQEIFKYEKLSNELGLPKNATRKEVDDLLLEIKKEKRRDKAAEKARAKALEEKRIEAKRVSLGLNAEADPELAEKLFKSAEQGLQAESINSAGYLYFKVWVLPDGSKWYKIGITNDLRRRDAEQNVLPVPATTLQSTRFFNIEHARIVEKKFLETLSSYRIKGANNKELLSLKPEQVQAIVGAMKAIKICTF